VTCVSQIDTDVTCVTFELAARLESVAGARRQAIGWLRQSAGGAAADDVLLIVSELVTNAVVHSGGATIGCDLRLMGRLLYIGVTDEGVSPTGPAVGQPADEDDSGRGLLLVSTIGVRWGFTQSASGRRTTWATVRLGGGAAG
jgi:anti-sigma regulatory factor (Ser/Thr protein kinase)